MLNIEGSAVYSSVFYVVMFLLCIVIVNIIFIIITTWQSAINAKLKESVDNAVSAGRALLSIINDILDFSKIESGKMEIVPIEYEISSLINDINDFQDEI